MTLPSSGGLTIAQILAEIGDSFPVTIPNANWRTLAGKPTGPLVIPTDFYGKSWKSAAFMGLVDEGASVSFGAAAANRLMVAVIHWLEGGTHFTLDSATIGGQAATRHQQSGHSGGVTGFGVAIISAVVPSGTSGVVECTFSGAPSAVFCGVYRLVGLASSTPTDVEIDQSIGTTSDQNVTIAVADGGIVIAGFTGSTNASSSVSWTGVTEQYDDDPSIHRSSGFASGLAAQNLSVTADITVQVDSGNGMVVVSWS